MAEHEEDRTPLTMVRKTYILGMLVRKIEGGSWIRIAAGEFHDFGGASFFEGCNVEYLSDGSWFTKSEAKGWGYQPDRVRVQLPYKISASSTGWAPGYTQHTTEGKSQMEHHIDRSKLIEVVTQNKEAYDLVLKRAQALYRDEIEKKTEQHVQGQIAVNEITVRDQNGQITIPQDMSETFDKQLRALELDSRDVIILDDGEYQVYVEAQATNIANLGATAKRLEELP